MGPNPNILTTFLALSYIFCVCREDYDEVICCAVPSKSFSGVYLSNVYFLAVFSKTSLHGDPKRL